MKLVTGIEAIQSGKPFRYCPPNNVASHWMTISDGTISFTIHEFMMCSWQIKQEPREFWIFNKAVDDYIECQSVIQTVYPNEDGWIKVREVME